MKQEYKQNIREEDFAKASNSYLMSLIAVVGGLPFPIINLIATFFFFLANRKGSYFVRWHCTQALLSQFSLVFVNATAFWWTAAIFFTDATVNDYYFAYVILVIIINLVEFITTIRSVISLGKGRHFEWWIFAGLSDILCKERESHDDWLYKN